MATSISSQASGTTKPDYKLQYREVCEELEEFRRSSTKTENELFKSVLRLALGFSGRDSDFDRKLAHLRDVLRKGASAEQRRTQIQSVLSDIGELADKSSANSGPGLPDLLDELMGQIHVDEDSVFELNALRGHLNNQDDDSDPHKLLGKIAAFLSEQIKAQQSLPANNSIVARTMGEDSDFSELLKGLRLSDEAGASLTELRRRYKEAQDHRIRVQLVEDSVQLINRTVTRLQRNQLEPGAVSNAELAAVVLELIDWLALPEGVSEAIEEIKTSLLSEQLDSHGLTRALKGIADVVVDLHADLEQEIGELEQFLVSMGEHIEEVERRLEESQQAHSESMVASVDLHQDLQAELVNLDIDSAGHPAAADLKKMIGTRIEALSNRVEQFLEGEQARHDASRHRLEDMQGNLRKLEGEADHLRKLIRAERAKALTDALTGLPNRRSLREQLTARFAQWSKDGSPLHLLIVDIDFFKRVNDNFGHAVGDRVLVHVARLCRDQMRDEDFLARFGGEEFVAVLPGCTQDAAIEIAERLRKEVEQVRFHLRGEPVPVTLSVGIAGFAKGDSIVNVMERADAALYRAKDGGRNRVES